MLQHFFIYLTIPFFSIKVQESLRPLALTTDRPQLPDCSKPLHLKPQAPTPSRRVTAHGNHSPPKEQCHPAAGQRPPTPSLPRSNTSHSSSRQGEGVGTSSVSPDHHHWL